MTVGGTGMNGISAVQQEAEQTELSQKEKQ
jgi:hypothetical protein